MLARAALAVSAMLLAFVLGLATAPATMPTLRLTHPFRVSDLRLDAPADAAADAAAVLAGAHPAPPRPTTMQTVVEHAPRSLPPPPPPGPEVVLRASLSAVSDEGGRLSLILNGAGPRRLREGDAFMGWRLASVTRSGAVLRKGGERREVSFFGAPASQAMAAGVAAPVFLPSGTARPAQPMARPPTAAEFFRGFKG